MPRILNPWKDRVWMLRERLGIIQGSFRVSEKSRVLLEKGPCRVTQKPIFFLTSWLLVLLIQYNGSVLGVKYQQP